MISVSSASRSAGRTRLPADAATVLGLLLVVVGTFLPWLYSGSVTRNSYATGGALRRLLAPSGMFGALLDAWSFLPVGCAAAIALIVVRHALAGCVVALVMSLAAGAAAFTALTHDTDFLVRPATAGPAVTAAGAVLVWLAVLARFLPLDRMTRRLR